jgi:branched-chain amino acid aminotransferase
MAAGTAAALVPIKSIMMESKGDKFVYRDGSDEPGPACVKLLTTLKGIQQGKIEDTFGWLGKVQEPIGYSNVSSNGDALDGDNTVGRLP